MDADHYETKRSKRLQQKASGATRVSAPRRLADIGNVLAQQLSNGEWSVASIATQLQDIAGTERRLFQEFAEHLHDVFGPARPSCHHLRRYLPESKRFRRIVTKFPAFRGLLIASTEPVMQPAPGPPTSWRVPEILTPKDLAAWLATHPNEMWWLADTRNAWHSVQRRRHYRQRWSRKRSGGWRLIEAPKARLKQVQRDIAHGILNRIPPHACAHGFCLGRNIQSFVYSHTSHRFAIRMDLSDFFPSIGRAQVASIFRTAGYPDSVSALLSQLTTTVTPTETISQAQSNERGIIELYRAPHLPQGSPSSPALANLAAYRLDCRLAGLAKQFDASYTRYADDLLFSGDHELRRSASRFHVFVLSIILEEGFRINPRKTRMMPSAARQRAAGLVFNEIPNTPRQDYERLKAILHNCKVHGPESQNHESRPNFRQHLLGRVQFHAQTNPRRGEKLMRWYHEAFAN